MGRSSRTAMTALTSRAFSISRSRVASTTSTPRRAASARSESPAARGAPGAVLGRQQRHRDERAAARVRVHVETHVDAAGREVVDETDAVSGIHVIVRDVRAHAAHPDDLRHLGEACRRGGLVPAAHVGDVEPACRGDGCAQRGELTRLGEGTRHVVEPRRQPERPVGEAGFDQPRHVGQLAHGRRRGIHAHHGMSHGSRGYEIAGTERGGSVVGGEQVGDRPACEGRVGSVDRGEVARGPSAVAGGVRDAVLAADDGRHPLPQQRPLRVGSEHRPVGVRVRVDEARNDSRSSASSTRSPAALSRASPISAITPSTISTSARWGSAPAPSTTPPRTSSRSALTGVLSFGGPSILSIAACRPVDRPMPAARGREGSGGACR